MNEQITLTGFDDSEEKYRDFVDKFKPKKTTDDCYTPPPVYDAVADYVRRYYKLEGRNFVRPFYPGGDFENYQYQPDDVVVDNPPFSIMTKIITFYIQRKIPFFLFAPGLMIHYVKDNCTFIGCGVDVIYENGANVKTRPEAIPNFTKSLTRPRGNMSKIRRKPLATISTMVTF